MRSLRFALVAAWVAAVCGCQAPETGTGLDPKFTNLRLVDEQLFSGMPTEEGLRAARDQGVVLVVSALTPGELLSNLDFDEARTVENLGISYVSIPFTPATFGVEHVAAFARVFPFAIGTVLTHCSTGNRAGGLYAAYLNIYEQVPIDEAIKRGKAAGLRSGAMTKAVKRIQLP